MDALKHFCNTCLCAVVLSANAGDANKPTPCAQSISELKILLNDKNLPLVWHETTMQDGKPLIVTIGERGTGLVLTFVKTKEGLWAESAGRFCKTNTGFELLFGKDEIRLGPAAHWLLRVALGDGGRFVVTRQSDESLDISATGWSGNFTSVSP